MSAAASLLFGWLVGLAVLAAWFVPTAPPAEDDDPDGGW